MEIKLKRVYEPPQAEDGFRILVDRLWPRGLSKENASLDQWDKEMSPSAELRQHFHQNGDWPDFKKKYSAELSANKNWPNFLAIIKEQPVVTLLYG
mgnify:FL=1